MLSTAPRSVHTELVKRLTIRQILVPIDFSEMSIEANPAGEKSCEAVQCQRAPGARSWFDYPAGFTALPGPVPGWSTVQEEVERSLAARLQEVASKSNCRQPIVISAPVRRFLMKFRVSHTSYPLISL